MIPLTIVNDNDILSKIENAVKRISSRANRF